MIYQANSLHTGLIIEGLLDILPRNDWEIDALQEVSMGKPCLAYLTCSVEIDFTWWYVGSMKQAVKVWMISCQNFQDVHFMVCPVYLEMNCGCLGAETFVSN